MNGVGIFLDRDGTINQEVDFLHHPNLLKLIPRSAEAIANANKRGWKVFVITNQSGIARGILTETTLTEIHDALRSELKKHDAHLDGVYFCPHHPDFGEAPYRQRCSCRKPNTGMLTQAAKDFDIDLKKSFVIGDRMIDMQTGNNCGATSILVLTGYGHEEQLLCKEHNVPVDYIAKDLFDAMQHVATLIKQKEPSIC